MCKMIPENNQNHPKPHNDAETKPSELLDLCSWPFQLSLIPSNKLFREVHILISTTALETLASLMHVVCKPNQSGAGCSKGG